MIRKVLLFFLFVIMGFSKDIYFDGYISKVAFNNNYLIAGLENGKIVIKKFNKDKVIDSFKLPEIEDFMGDKIPMPIYSLDIDGDKLLILAEGEESVRKLFIYDLSSKKLEQLFTSPKTFMKAKFVGKNRIVFGLLSDEVALYDYSLKKFIYTKQIGNYVFSTFALNSDRSRLLLGDESGAVKLVRVKDGKIERIFNKFNKDQTISLAYMKKLGLNATADKRVSLFDVDSGRYLLKLEAKFLPYGVAISPNENYIAFQYDEKNRIVVYDKYGKLITFIEGHTMPLNGMRFIDNNKVLSFSADKIIISKIKE